MTERRKRHRIIEFDDTNSDEVSQLASELDALCCEDDYESDSDTSEEDWSESDEDDSEESGTEPASDDDIKLKSLLRELDPEGDNESGVYRFGVGDIGISRIKKYRVRPPLEQMNYSVSNSFEFQLNHTDYQIKSDSVYIRIYGITREGYSVVANVYGYKPYFTVCLPDDMASAACIQELLAVLEKEVRRRCSEKQHYENIPLIVDYRLCDGIDTRGYMDHTRKYLTIYMMVPPLVATARRVIESDDWLYADRVCETFESDIDFTLRYMTDRDFTGECTLTVPAARYSIRPLGRMSCTVDIEIDIPNYEDLQKAEEQIDVSNKVVMSYDAEMKSEGFPQPKKDPVINIAMRVRVIGQPTTRHICLSLGSSGSVRYRHPDADVLCFEREEDLLLAYRALLIATDADVLTGYNIDNFDMPYFIKRAEHLDIHSFGYLGRLRGRRSLVKDRRYSDRARGVEQGSTVNIEGRLRFDALKIVLREFRLRSYTLNNVSKLLLGSEKEDMSYRLIPEKHESVNGRTELNSYCLKDAKLPDQLLEKMRSLLKYSQKARVTGVTVQSLIDRGLGFQGKSQVYRTFQRQSPRVFVYVRTEAQRKADMLNPSYGGAHVEQPVKGYHTWPVVTLDYGSLYPSIIIAWNMCCTTRITVQYARERGWKRASLHGDGSDGDYFQIPDLSSPEKEALFEKLFKNGGTEADYEALYSDSDACFVTKKHRVGNTPIILSALLTNRKGVKRDMAYHAEQKERLREYAADVVTQRQKLLQLIESYRTLVKEKQAALETKPRDALKLEREVKRLQWKIEQLQAVVDRSEQWRRQSAQEALEQADAEEFLEVLANLFQLEIKLSGNSMYGLYGAKTSFLYCMAIAAAVTSMGKFMILLTKYEVEKQFCTAKGYEVDCKVIYGDTDSVFVEIPHVTMERARVLGMEMSAYIAKLWPPPHKLEAEKIYKPLLLAKKKKYAGLKFEMDPETGGLKDGKVDSSGLETVRRDNCVFATEVMDGVLKLLMTSDNDGGVQASIDYIKQQVAALLRGDINIFRLIISKKLRRDSYAHPTIHSEVARKQGKLAGERIAYLVVKKGAGAKLYECGMDPDIAFRTNATIDYDYYLKKQIMEPIIRLFAPVLAPSLDIDSRQDRQTIRQIVIRRIFVGPHMDLRRVTLNTERVERSGIFKIMPQCGFCRHALKDGETEFCAKCKRERREQLTDKLCQNMQQLCLQSMHQWQRCQTCMEVKHATHVVCDQTDCENYWLRRKTAVDLDEVTKKLESLQW